MSEARKGRWISGTIGEVDTRSMRVLELLVAGVAIAGAVLISLAR